MLSYALRRIVVFVPTLFITLTLIFVLTRMLPGSPVASLLGGQSPTPPKCGLHYPAKPTPLSVRLPRARLPSGSTTFLRLATSL